MQILKNDSQRQLITRSRAWNIVKILVAVLLVFFILAQTSLNELFGLWQRISLPWLVCSILVYCLTTWSMARRYWILINKQIAFRHTLSVVIVQTVVGNVVATSAGATSFVTLLRAKYRIPLSQGILSVFLARFGDVIALLVALALSSLTVWAQIARLHWLVVLAGLGLVTIVIMFVLTIIFRKNMMTILNHLLQILRLDRFAVVARSAQKLTTLTEQDPGTIRHLTGPFMSYSVLTLFLTTAFSYCNMRAFSVHIGLWPILFIISVTQLISVIPIQVFGGLGTYDVTSMYLYGLFGISQPTIVPVVVAGRIYFYLLNLLLLLYLPIDSWANRREQVYAART